MLDELYLNVFLVINFKTFFGVLVKILNTITFWVQNTQQKKKTKIPAKLTSVVSLKVESLELIAWIHSTAKFGIMETAFDEINYAE